MLRATRQLLRPGGRTAFFTIYAPRGLEPPTQRRARAAAPRYGWSRADHTALLRSAGFRDVVEIDRTEEYRRTLQAWYQVNERHADEMKALTSADAFEERQRERVAALAAIDEGIQRRVLIVGTAPGAAALRRRGSG